MDGTVIIKRPRFANFETTEHTDGDVTTKTYIVRIELKRLGYLSLGLILMGGILGWLIA